jgi:hypothetical protein
MYLFGDKQYVLHNMSDEAAPLTLRFPKETPTSGWHELVVDMPLTVKQDSTYVRLGGPVTSNISLELKPFEIAVVQSP